MKINLDEVIKLLLIYILAIVLIVFLWSCNPLKKAENRVLANVESVKRVRAATDPLFPCANDSLVFIHDSTTVTNTEYQRDTLVDIRNDSTFIYYFDTVTLEKTRYQVVNTIITDKKEINKLKDSINALRIREANLIGQTSEQKFQYNKMKGERNIWRIVAFSLIVFIIFAGIMKLLNVLKLI